MPRALGSAREHHGWLRFARALGSFKLAKQALGGFLPSRTGRFGCFSPARAREHDGWPWQLSGALHLTARALGSLMPSGQTATGVSWRSSREYDRWPWGLNWELAVGWLSFWEFLAPGADCYGGFPVASSREHGEWLCALGSLQWAGPALGFLPLGADRSGWFRSRSLGNTTSGCGSS